MCQIVDKVHDSYLPNIFYISPLSRPKIVKMRAKFVKNLKILTPPTHLNIDYILDLICGVDTPPIFEIFHNLVCFCLEESPKKRIEAEAEQGRDPVKLEIVT